MMFRAPLLRLLLACAALAGAAPAHALAAAPTSPVRVDGITPRSLADDEVYGASSRTITGRSAAGVAGAYVGPQSLLVIRAYYSGEGWAAVTDPSMAQYDPAEIQSRLTSSASSSGAMLYAQSDGQVSLTGLNGPDADVSDWFTLGTTMPRLASGACDANTIRTQALAAATTAGDSPGSYDHVMIVFPYTTACSWAGLGQVGGKITWINGFFQNDAVVDSAVAAHEIGHNLGVQHASSLACTQPSADPSVAVLTSTSCTLPLSSSNPSASDVPVMEYGDPFDMMGTMGYTFPWRGTELMSTWHRAQLLELPEASQQTATAEGAYTLKAAQSGSGVRLIRIARGTGPSTMAELALEYRPADSTFDQWALSGSTPTAGGVLVRLVPTLTTSSYSYLLDGTPETRQQYVGPTSSGAFVGAFDAAWRDAALRPGRSLVDQPSGIEITVDSVTADSATIELHGGLLSTNAAAVTPTPTPTPAPAAPTPMPDPSYALLPTPAPAPAPTPTPTPSATPDPSGSSSGPSGRPKLLWPVARKGTIRLTSTRRVTVRFPGAGRVSASLGTRWYSSRTGSTVTFKLPASAVANATIRFRATQGSLTSARTATMRVRRGVVTFSAS